MSKKMKGTALSFPAGVVVGAVIGLVCIVLMLSLLSALILRGSVRGESVGYYIMAVLLLSTMLASWVGVRMVKRRRLLVCTTTATLIFAALALCNIMLFGGLFTGIITAVLTIASGAMLIAVSGKRVGWKRKFSAGKYHSR